MLEHVDWVLSRLRAEYTAMTHSVADGLQAGKCCCLETYGIDYLLGESEVQLAIDDDVFLYLIYCLACL
jgi:hypothetical protein